MSAFPDRSALETALEAILSRVGHTLSELGTEAFPFYADPETGEWETLPDGNWCGGHWIGLLWLAARRRDDDRYAAAAGELADRVGNDLPADAMFHGMIRQYAGFRGYDVTGDRDLFGLGLSGADAMLSSFDAAGRQIPHGEAATAGIPLDEASNGVDGGSVDGGGTYRAPEGSQLGAVDAVYTSLPVLWRAYRETGDERFRDAAVSHADRHVDWYIRPDGRTWHHAVFDPDDGSLLAQYNGLAHSEETCWARGQGWNIAGLARAYTETGAERYLRALESTTEYYVEHSPENRVCFWDFEDPAIPNAPRDTSGAALTAYGLARLTGSGGRVRSLRAVGGEILGSIIEDYLVREADDPRYGMVESGCYNRPDGLATDNELIWTDYYVAYTLDSLLRRGSAAGTNREGDGR